MARPTKYNEAIQSKADEYLTNYEDYDQVVPSNVGLALHLGVTKETLLNWGDKNPVFLRTLADIQAKQHIVLISKGLTTEFNSNITKLMLHNHGYSDKKETALTIDAAGDFLEAITPTGGIPSDRD